jgi:hypothetical protein
MRANSAASGEGFCSELAKGESGAGAAERPRSEANGPEAAKAGKLAWMTMEAATRKETGRRKEFKTIGRDSLVVGIHKFHHLCEFSYKTLRGENRSGGKDNSV